MRYQYILLLAISVSAVSSCTINPANEKLPDIVVCLGDDHGVYHSTPYGSKMVQTPNMQFLADKGLKFHNAYVASPSCAPSRAALFTGLMPYNNGIVGNHEKVRKPGVKPLLPLMAAKGYEIAWYGKVGHGPGSESGKVTIIPRAAKSSRLDINDVEKWMAARPDPDKPLLLFVGSRYPHRPWPEPKEARVKADAIEVPDKTFDTPEVRSEMRRYVEAVEILDRKIGHVRKIVDKHLDPDNTLIMYSSDHGQAWPFGKWSLYEAGIRTPMLIFWPGKIKPGTTTDAMVSWIDLIPTFIDIAGGEVPWTIDGRSFKNVLLGKTDSHRSVIYAVHKGGREMNVYPIRSARKGKWKYIRNLNPEFYYTTHMDLVTPDSGKEARYFNRNWPSWVEAAKTNPEAAAFLRAYHSRPAEELYMIDKDPHEKVNLADNPKHKTVLESLRGMVAERMERVKDDRSLSGTPRLLKDHPLR